MRKRKAVLAVCLGAVFLTGCLGIGGSSALKTDSSRIYVTDESGFQTATVKPYEVKEYYNLDELKSYLNKAVGAFNETYGQNGVTLQSCTMEKGIASAIFAYGSGEALCDFTAKNNDNENHVDSIAIVPLSQVIGESESEGVTFIKADGKAADKKALLNKSDCNTVVVTGNKPVTIQTQKRLLFVSDNVVVKDQHTVEITQGKSYIIYK
ncbi:hypothetical protein [Clostridium sp. E02]|uniref:hypothetical protein n=1 Tax=Clostridium sp. E02 TaxID=2487134 RepID=UPI000F532BDD|nr:hypothetical protein [Clostridium sp. E02]